MVVEAAPYLTWWEASGCPTKALHRLYLTLLNVSNFAWQTQKSKEIDNLFNQNQMESSTFCGHKNG